MSDQIIAYKGFNFRRGKLKCRDFVYEEGKTYYTPKATLCVEGFHACKFPLDVFNYYSPVEINFYTSNPVSYRRYNKVLLEDVSEDYNLDSKVVAKKITILEEVSVREMIEISKSFYPNPFCLSECKANNTDRTFKFLVFDAFDSGFLIKDDVTKAIPIYEDSYIFNFNNYGERGISYAPFDESKGSFMKKMYSIPRTEIEESYSLWRGVPSQHFLDEYNERIRHVRKS